jgi:hypothetical protein
MDFDFRFDVVARGFLYGHRRSDIDQIRDHTVRRTLSGKRSDAFGAMARVIRQCEKLTQADSPRILFE